MNDTDPISQTGRASAIASIAHRRQRDKLDYAYIAHTSRPINQWNTARPGCTM
jgi:hypothetical protein